MTMPAVLRDEVTKMITSGRNIEDAINDLYAYMRSFTASKKERDAILLYACQCAVYARRSEFNRTLKREVVTRPQASRSFDERMNSVERASQTISRCILTELLMPNGLTLADTLIEDIPDFVAQDRASGNGFFRRMEFLNWCYERGKKTPTSKTGDVVSAAAAMRKWRSIESKNYAAA